MNRWRKIVGFLFTMFLSIFGVYFYSQMNYQGVTLKFIFEVQFAEGQIYEGLYSLWASGFACDWWYFFSFENIGTEGLANILANPVVLPAILSWFTAGFMGGVFMRKPRFGFYMSMGYYSFWVIFLVIFMILAGADLTQMFTIGFYTTTGKLMTGLIWINIGGVLGGLIANEDFK